MTHQLKKSLRRLLALFGIDAARLRRGALRVLSPRLTDNPTLKQIARLHVHCLAVNFQMEKMRIELRKPTKGLLRAAMMMQS